MKWRVDRGTLLFSHDTLMVKCTATVWKLDTWQTLPWEEGSGGLRAKSGDIELSMKIREVDPATLDYFLTFSSADPARLRLELEPADGTPAELFHLIPACMFGDNNHAGVNPNEFPTLSPPHPANKAAADLWEFRADRATHPVSLVCSRAGIFGISIDPFSDDPQHADGFIRNGLISRMPAGCGASLGYGNTPWTFVDKRNFQAPTHHLTRHAAAGGSIFLIPGGIRTDAHRIIRRLYSHYHCRPDHARTVPDAIEALARAFIEINYSREFENYCNLKCRVPVDTALKPWRPLSEIGWTGGSVLAYPMLLAEKLIPNLVFPKPPEDIFNAIASVYHQPSGFLRDVYGPALVGMPPNQKIVSHGVNGWWSGFMPSTKDRHCAYTNGHAAYYLLKAARLLEQSGRAAPPAWQLTATKVLRTAMALQRGDGAFGYTFHVNRCAVDDWDGYAGCWFVPGLVLAAELTGDPDFLQAARRGLAFYSRAVFELNCRGTPMDTWKSVDQEGVLAFIIGARLLHQRTGDDTYLQWMKTAAEYEFLWRYGFKARPEFPPLKNSPWNSCGGSVTSVSNPHIHPMGLLITDALYYLAENTGDHYFRNRADDAISWILNTMELYPAVVGYGRYGVLSERFCPSDGLTIDTFEDSGKPASTWWSYNGWAAANAMEGLAEWWANRK